MSAHPSVYPPALIPGGAAHAAYGLLVRLLERLEARKLLSDSEIATIVDQVALELPLQGTPLMPLSASVSSCCPTFGSLPLVARQGLFSKGPERFRPGDNRRTYLWNPASCDCDIRLLALWTRAANVQG